MRTAYIAGLFAILFLASVECKPARKDGDIDYPGDEDYDEESEGAGREESDPATASTEPPSHIYNKGQNFRVHLGEAIKLPCNVSYAKNVLVLWKRGSELLYSDDSPHTSDINRIIRLKDNSLVIYDFRANDSSDNYTCTITSDPQETIRHSVRLYDEPTIPTTIPTSVPNRQRQLIVSPGPQVVLNRNSDVTLSCTANWEPKPKISWSHRGERLTSDKYPDDGSSLTIRNVTIKNVGLYQCLAENKSGNENPELGEIELLVPHAPMIKLDSEYVYTGLGRQSELTCWVYAYPRAAVVWYKGNGSVVHKQGKAESKDLTETKYTLAFGEIAESDLGSYRCQASNSQGNAEGTIVLTGVPREAQFVGGRVAEDDVTPIVEWIVTSYSPITEYRLEYRQKGAKNWQVAIPRATDDGTSNTFKVEHAMKGLQPASYEVVLMARNDFGWSPRPRTPHEFSGEFVPEEPETAGRSGATATQSLVISKALLLAASLYVYTTCL